MLQFSTKAKITNFDLHFAIQKNISQFHISMDDSFPM